MSLTQVFLVYIPALALAIAVHEFGHALFGALLGDPTPRQQGRVSLNPLVHLDPVGILLPLLLALYGSPMMFGWGKPVLIDYMNLKRPIRDEAIIAFAGPLMNFLSCFVCLLLWKPVYAYLRYGTLFGSGILAESALAGSFFLWAREFLAFCLNINLGLMLFNLLPFPPLDGSKILFNLFGERGKWLFRKIQVPGFILLMFLLFSGSLNRILLGPYKAILSWFISM